MAKFEFVVDADDLVTVYDQNNADDLQNMLEDLRELLESRLGIPVNCVWLVR